MGTGRPAASASPRNKGIYQIKVVQRHAVRVPRRPTRRSPGAVWSRVLLSLLGLSPGSPSWTSADNSSEYLNHRVAVLLASTPSSRAPAPGTPTTRLVDGKNASVVHKWFGHAHIPRRFAPLVDRFAGDVLSPADQLLPTLPVSRRAVRRPGAGPEALHHDAVMTPYERLKFIDGAERFLKPGITLELLDRTGPRRGPPPRRARPPQQRPRRAVPRHSIRSRLRPSPRDCGDRPRPGRLPPESLEVGTDGARLGALRTKPPWSPSAAPRSDEGSGTILPLRGSPCACQGFASRSLAIGHASIPGNNPTATPCAADSMARIRFGLPVTLKGRGHQRRKHQRGSPLSNPRS